MGELLKQTLGAAQANPGAAQANDVVAQLTQLLARPGIQAELMAAARSHFNDQQQPPAGQANAEHAAPANTGAAAAAQAYPGPPIWIRGMSPEEVNDAWRDLILRGFSEQHARERLEQVAEVSWMSNSFMHRYLGVPQRRHL